MHFPRIALALIVAGGFLQPTPRAEGASSLRYLALGDSYTIGEGVEASERWPERLASLLRERGVPLGAPEIVARTGWTTDELEAAIARERPRGPFGLVSLMIGVNDQFRGRDAAIFRAGLIRLIERAVAFAGGEPRRVVVVSIPDWSGTPFAEGRNRGHIAGEIDRFNGIEREEARRLGVRFVDVTPSSRAVADDPSQLARDGLHPSGLLYERWARLVLPEALAAVRGSPGPEAPRRKPRVK